MTEGREGAVMSPREEAEEILAAWRAAERRRARARAGSAERRAAEAEAERLREAYHRHVETELSADRVSVPRVAVDSAMQRSGSSGD